MAKINGDFVIIEKFDFFIIEKYLNLLLIKNIRICFYWEAPESAFIEKHQNLLLFVKHQNLLLSKSTRIYYYLEFALQIDNKWAEQTSFASHPKVVHLMLIVARLPRRLNLISAIFVFWVKRFSTHWYVMIISVMNIL